jgi:HSP20 family molecular chaperone IbpA
VDITLQNDVLTISGERKAEQEEERGGYHIRERRYGSFSRRPSFAGRPRREQDSCSLRQRGLGGHSQGCCCGTGA